MSESDKMVQGPKSQHLTGINRHGPKGLIMVHGPKGDEHQYMGLRAILYMDLRVHNQ